MSRIKIGPQPPLQTSGCLPLQKIRQHELHSLELITYDIRGALKTGPAAGAPILSQCHEPSWVLEAQEALSSSYSENWRQFERAFITQKSHHTIHVLLEVRSMSPLFLLVFRCLISELVTDVLTHCHWCAPTMKNTDRRMSFQKQRSTTSMLRNY